MNADRPAARMRKVAFVCDEPYQWSCLSSVHAAFTNHTQWEVALLTTSLGVHDWLCGQSPQRPQNPDYHHVEQAIRNSEVVFTSHPHTLEPFVVDEDTCKIAYIPYGMTISAADYSRRQQHDLWIHNRAWRVFVGSHYHKLLYERYCSRGSRHVVALGNPKWDLLAEEQNTPGYNRFLWNIHYTANASRGKKWSTWKDYGSGILDYFGARPELQLIVRPHPGFFRNLQSRSDAEILWKAIRRFPNIILDESPTAIDAMSACAALLTDGSSLIYDFAITGKPILYLRTSSCEMLHDHAFELVRRHFRVGDRLDVLGEFIDDCLHETARKTKERKDQTVQYFGYDRCSTVGSRICEYVVASSAVGE